MKEQVQVEQISSQPTNLFKQTEQVSPPHNSNQNISHIISFGQSLSLSKNSSISIEVNNLHLQIKAQSVTNSNHQSKYEKSSELNSNQQHQENTNNLEGILQSTDGSISNSLLNDDSQSVQKNCSNILSAIKEQLLSLTQKQKSLSSENIITEGSEEQPQIIQNQGSQNISQIIHLIYEGAESFEIQSGFDESLQITFAINQMKNNHYGKAIRRLKKVIKFFHQKNKPLNGLFLCALNNLAWAHYGIYKWNCAKALFQTALQITIIIHSHSSHLKDSDSKNHIIQVAEAHDNLGIIQNKLANTPAAIYYFQKVLKIYSLNLEIVDIRKLAKTIQNLATTYMLECRYSEAADCYSRIIQLFTNQGEIQEKYEKYQLDISKTYHNLAVAFYCDSSFQKALENSQLAYEISYKKSIIERFSELNIVHKLIGQIYCSMGQHNKAISSYIKILEAHKKKENDSRDNQMKADVLNAMGVTYGKMKRYKKAQQFLSNALSIYKKSKLKRKDNILAEIRKNLVIVKLSQCLYKEAFELFNVPQVEKDRETQQKDRQNEQKNRETEQKNRETQQKDSKKHKQQKSSQQLAKELKQQSQNFERKAMEQCRQHKLVFYNYTSHAQTLNMAQFSFIRQHELIVFVFSVAFWQEFTWFSFFMVFSFGLMFFVMVLLNGNFF